MSVFTIIRRGRMAAKEHNAQKAEKEKKEVEKQPYRHVPTHAAVDALSGAPSSWRQEDRPRILEQNRRRSAMVASGMGRGMGGIMTPVHAGMPRTNSALSHVSYPSVYASPVVNMPRNYSYSSIHPGWNERGGEVVYSQVDQGNATSKGKEVDRVLMVDSGRASRTSSKAYSPVGSSSDSSSSQDDLEMKPTKHSSGSKTVAAADVRPSRPATDLDQPHRLHPSRRVSDPPAMNPAYTSQTRSSYYPPSSSSARPGPSRGMSNPTLSPGIPPVPALPPMHFGTLAPQQANASSSASTQSTRTTASTSTSLSSITIVPTPAKAGSKPSTPPTPKANPPSSFSDMIPDFKPVSEALIEPSLSVGMAVSTPSLAHKNRRISKTARFTELDTIPSNLSRSEPTSPARRDKDRASVNVASLPTEFNEASFWQSNEQASAIQSLTAQPRTNRLSKAPRAPPATVKPAKKNRWSLRSSKSTAVAV